MENAFRKNILQRIPSALFLAALLIALLFLQSNNLIYTVVSIIGVMLVVEWYKNAKRNYLLGAGILISLLLGLFIFPHLLVLNVLIIGIFWITIVFSIKFQKPSGNSYFSFNNLFLSQFLIVGFISSAVFIFLEHNEFGVNKFLLLFLLVFQTAMVDIFAYIVGSNIGKTPITPSISPNKTLEGLAGGLFFAAILSIGISILISVPLKTISALVLLLPFAIAGDLLESLIKRSSNIKDSGSIFPGHGGLWDRLDSHIAVISAAPIVFILCFNLA
ncbi:MAG: phosphatidate cytidylyltransferase [Gammaproteobacteria bacterium]